MSDSTKKSIVINKSFLSGSENSNGSNINNKKSKKNTRNLSEEIIKPNKLKKMLLDKINAKRKAEQGSHGGMGGMGGMGGTGGAGDNTENSRTNLDISKETKIFSSEFKKSLDFLDNYIGQKRNDKFKSKTLKKQNQHKNPATSLNNDILKYINNNNNNTNPTSTSNPTQNVVYSTNHPIQSIQTPQIMQANNVLQSSRQHFAPTPPVTTISAHSTPPLFQKIQLNIPSKSQHQTTPNLSTGSGPAMITNRGGVITHLPSNTPKINLSLGKVGNENTLVYTELPPELQNFTPPVYNISSPSISPSPFPDPISVNDASLMGVGETNMMIDKTGGATGAGENEKFEEIINNIEPPNTVNIGKTSLELSTPTFSPIKLTDDAPYGCLKNGKKPTFRMYNKTIKNNIKFHDTNTHNSDNTDTIYSDRQTKLKNLQNKHNKNKYPSHQNVFHEKHDNNDNDDNNDNNSYNMKINKEEEENEKEKNIKKTKIRRHLRKTITKKFKLGKQTGQNIVGVLIKNNDTRKNIEKEHGLLKSKQLAEVKKYLVEKNLIKIGSTAPPGVIRNIYEASMLSGEVDNIGKGVILHNFLEDKKMW
jgi:hypothetical protein